MNLKTQYLSYIMTFSKGKIQSACLSARQIKVYSINWKPFDFLFSGCAEDEIKREGFPSIFHPERVSLNQPAFADDLNLDFFPFKISCRRLKDLMDIKGNGAPLFLLCQIKNIINTHNQEKRLPGNITYCLSLFLLSFFQISNPARE